MVTAEGLRRLLQGQTSPSPALQECIEAIDKGDVRQKDSGSLSAQDALSMYWLRRDTTRRAGTTTAGFEEVIAALERCPPVETVQLFHFRGKRKLFTVVVASSSGEIFGCLWVTLNWDTPMLAQGSDRDFGPPGMQIGIKAFAEHGISF